MEGYKKILKMKKPTEICTFSAIIILVFWYYYSYYLANIHDKKKTTIKSSEVDSGCKCMSVYAEKWEKL